MSTAAAKADTLHKVRPLLDVMNKSADFVRAPAHLSGDEADCGFQGRHSQKQTIKFKREGDGFLADVLADDVAYRPVGSPSRVVRGVAAVLETVLVAPSPGVEDGHVEVVEVHVGGRRRAVVVLRTAARVDGVARAVETVLHVVVADGRVAGLTEYVDDPAAAVALGVQRG